MSVTDGPALNVLPAFLSHVVPDPYMNDDEGCMAVGCIVTTLLPSSRYARVSKKRREEKSRA